MHPFTVGALSRALRPSTARFVQRTPVFAPLFPAATATASATASVRCLSWDAQPAPPRLPAEEQAEFERLVKEAQESAAAASLADAMRDAMGDAEALASARAKAAAAAEQEDARNEAALNAEKLSAPSAASAPSVNASNAATAATAGLNGNPIEGVWRGAPPEFDGDRNPRTGEVGGPKNEPLRWGAAGDWSYNGRVTDF